MNSSSLDHLSEFSWTKEEVLSEAPKFEALTINTVKKYESGLKYAKFLPTKIFNVFLLINKTSQTSSSVKFPQISLKLRLDITIRESLNDIFSEFSRHLEEQNSLFSLIEDPRAWTVRIAKKTGLPKDYIPAIDGENLLKSVESYTNLVLCPTKQSACITYLMNSSDLICSTKETSNAASNCKESLESSSFKDTTPSTYNKSSQLTTCSLRKKSSLKSELHYSSSGFYHEESQINDKKQLAKRQQEIISSCSKPQAKKTKSFFAFLCC